MYLPVPGIELTSSDFLDHSGTYKQIHGNLLTERKQNFKLLHSCSFIFSQNFVKIEVFFDEVKVTQITESQAYRVSHNYSLGDKFIIMFCPFGDSAWHRNLALASR